MSFVIHLEMTFIIFAACLFSIAFGFSSACIGTVLPDVIIKLLRRERFAKGYGIVLIFEGLGSFIGPPVAGWFLAGNSSYNLRKFCFSFRVFDRPLRRLCFCLRNCGDRADALRNIDGRSLANFEHGKETRTGDISAKRRREGGHDLKSQGRPESQHKRLKYKSHFV